MVTNYPQLTAPDRAGSDETTGSMFAARLMDRVGQLLCGLRGHDSIRHFERNRLTMRCTSCGHIAPGWEISGRGPRRRFEGDARHRLAVKQRLVLKKSA